MEQDTSAIEILDAANEDERRRFAEIDAESFGGRTADNMRWLAAAKPHAPLRLARIGGEVAWRAHSCGIAWPLRANGGPHSRRSTRRPSACTGDGAGKWVRTP